MHLIFDYMTAQIDCNEGRHAQAVLKGLGIKYQDSTPQTAGNQFWFWNCENVPLPLPKFLTELDMDPMDCIGFGLDKEAAIRISNYKAMKE